MQSVLDHTQTNQCLLQDIIANTIVHIAQEFADWTQILANIKAISTVMEVIYPTYQWITTYDLIVDKLYTNYMYIH